MKYIQIDKFGGNINIVCKNDDSGDPLIFDTKEEAYATLSENCQDGIVVPLDSNAQIYTKEEVDRLISYFDRINNLLNKISIINNLNENTNKTPIL